MTFLQPLILWGLPLVLLPVIIHLINRMRHTFEAVGQAGRVRHDVARGNRACRVARYRGRGTAAREYTHVRKFGKILLQRVVKLKEALLEESEQRHRRDGLRLE